MTIMKKKVTVTFEQDGNKAFVTITQVGNEATISIDFGVENKAAENTDFSDLAVFFAKSLTKQYQ